MNSFIADILWKKKTMLKEVLQAEDYNISESLIYIKKGKASGKK